MLTTASIFLCNMPFPIKFHYLGKTGLLLFDLSDGVKYHILVWGSRPEVFCKKGFLKNFAKFTGKHLHQSLFFKVAGLRPATLLKKRLWHMCFLVNFAKFLRITFFTEHPRWLLLSWKDYFLTFQPVFSCEILFSWRFSGEKKIQPKFYPFKKYLVRLFL